MGCASSLSSQESEAIFSEVKKNNCHTLPGDQVSSAPHSKPTAAGQQNPQQNGLTTDGQLLDKEEKGVLRGDVVRKHEARAEREKMMREKQRKVALAAEAMSAQVLDEKERLSLTSRSRATSRATSRTASPTGFSRREKTGQPVDVTSALPERDESKSDQSNYQYQHHNNATTSTARVIS